MGFNMAFTKFFIHKKDEYNYSGRVLTLGRQDIAVTAKDMKLLGIKIESSSLNTLTSEEYLRALGFHRIDEMDYSNHDGANIIHDLNKPVSKKLWEKFDFIIDGGTLEHCFNVSVFMSNLIYMLKPGGTIIHANPSQGTCNHGFYNFQPTFYYSFYKANNFEEMEFNFIEMYTSAKLIFEDKKARVRVVPVENWNNLDYKSTVPSYAMFKAVKPKESFKGEIVIPIQEFYYNIFKEKQRIGGGLINQQTYLKIRGDFKENTYDNIIKNAYWL